MRFKIIIIIPVIGDRRDNRTYADIMNQQHLYEFVHLGPQTGSINNFLHILDKNTFQIIKPFFDGHNGTWNDIENQSSPYEIQ